MKFSKSNLPKTDEIFLYRRNMEPESCKKLVKNFIDQLFRLRTHMIEDCLPKTVCDGFDHYKKLVKSDIFKKSSPQEKNQIGKKFEYLRQLRNLRIYSWNGSRYDLNCLIGPMLNVFSDNESGFQKMTCIKKANSYMQITFMGLVFRDMMNYSVPISLENFALSCGINDISKTIFPYELYSDILELTNATEFPHYKHFTSSLKSSYSEHFLVELDKIVEEKLSTKEWVQVIQILEYYNISEEKLFVLEGKKLVYTIEGQSLLVKSLHTSPKKYENSKNDFKNKYRNMLQYLEDYNLNDVRLLEKEKIKFKKRTNFQFEKKTY